MSSKIILVTGASTGFGNITAKLLAKNEHTVYATMREIDGKNKPHKEALLDWTKAEQVDLKVVELTVVDKMMGGVTEIINETAKQVQAGVLQNFGLSELNINN